MPLPLTTRTLLATARVGSALLPSICIGVGATQIGYSLAMKVTGKNTAFVRPLEGLLAGIATFGGCKIASDSALRRFTPPTPTGEFILFLAKHYHTIFAGAVIAGMFAFHVVGAMPVPESTSSSTVSSSDD
ncbi:hypothetical protein SDRG_02384 [Saprolegnia diclina VS20]|uniref:Uncharacterized protein n=1 Tax=Saprolegnia diclina (strain VS20) TaxID=1156394 RepID=T0S5Z0_SAPDV|nr:hypothetical protein SDRG_02384 [Saprolegnia diclina VS20]EQC40493.1 hypothetical protein SDRG_02384 [Saprolegnia diclina VS20]|eukprot:XP_008606192.1 hypothetical protein SDRG_02384 [Saprolegnia diclina VS20]